MDFIKSQFDRIQQQLSGLTASQKMLSAALVAIMVMTLWWWGNYAGTPEYAPLLDQSMTPEDIGPMRTQLRMAGIDHKVVDDKILVPPDKKLDALGFLGFANALPKNTTSGFDEMIKQLTAWDGQDRQAAIFNHGKELSLQRIISRFPGVSSATVLIDPSTKFRLGRPMESTATVSVTLRDPSGVTKKLAAACAHLVAGAQSGLKPSRVNVTINGQTFPITEDSGFGGGIAGSLIDIQQEAEAHENRKLEDHLSYIPGVRVSVTVRVNSAREATEAIEINKEKSGTFEQKTVSKTTEEVNPLPVGGDAGVGPNTGMTVAAAAPSAAVASTRNQSEDTVENLVVPATKKTTTQKAAGDHTVVAASVRVPRSYLVHEAKDGNPKASEPDSAALEKAIARVIPSIKSAVAANTGLKDADAISVEPYTDFVVPPGEPQIAGAGGITMALGGHIKEIALGGLALASLFMMSMMVRKGTVAPALPPAPAARPVAPATLSIGETLAGEATEQNPTLDGMELDEDSIKTQQMLSQVTSMVGDSPDTAAQLIKRWMNQR